MRAATVTLDHGPLRRRLVTVCYGDAWPWAATVTRSMGSTDDKTELGASYTAEEVELDAEPTSAVALASTHEQLP